MDIISFCPEHLKQFGDCKDVAFCLVTNSELMPYFHIEKQHAYSDYLIIAYDESDDFDVILQKKIPDTAHILVITPNCYFNSPHPDVLGKRRKLSVMACNSTPTTIEAINHFLSCGIKTNPLFLDKVAEKFFEIAQDSEKLTFIDEAFNTSAVFNHLDDSLQWHEQAGSLEWGQQQLYPAGEISTLPVDVYNMNIDASLNLNGEIVLRGYPVLHSGKQSFLKADQKRIFDHLTVLDKHPLIAVVEHGVITQLKITDKKSEEAKSILEAIFTLDSRYQTIIEIGFGINHWITPFPGNSAMNEVYAAEKGGSIHWGIGLSPYTQYHLDLICPYTSVLGKDKQIIFGKNNQSYDFL